MSSGDNEFISIAWQIPIEVHGDVVVKVNLKAVILKVLGYLGGVVFVGVIGIELVNKSSPGALGDRWSGELRPP